MDSCQHCGLNTVDHRFAEMQQAEDYAVMKSILEMFETRPESVMLITSMKRIMNDWQVHVLPECSPLSKA